MRAVFLFVSCAIAFARAQQTPNQEPLPENPATAPVPEELPLLPDEIMLLPQTPPTSTGARRGPLPPFKLKLEPLKIEPVLPDRKSVV